MSKERLDNSVLDNAISTYKTVVEVAGNIIDEDYSPVLDKVTLAFLEELKQYRDLEEQGLLIKLPTNVGETVYCLREGWDGWNIDKKKFEIRMIGNFGKTVFLTQSEAEEKLRELEGE